MNKERWQLVERIFHAALEREGEARSAFLTEACEGDEDLRGDVEALIAQDGQSFIESPALEIAAKQMAAESFSQAESSAPERIGPYKVLAQLGRGGMGEVHLALDTRLNRKVAIKLLPDEYTTDVVRVRRFQQEARAASALNHPNILTIHEIGRHDSLHFIAAEFIEGETLRQWMATASRSLQRVLEIATQIAGALAAAHAAGLVHRDIKPENIMVRPDGLVKVLDFGLAKLTEKASTVDTSAATELEARTDPGTVMGTAQYMSPEQARGQELDARTDIFSFAVVLYEMIAGKSPFEGATRSDVISSILTREPPSLSRSAQQAPAELERIVTKGLEKDREERYQTVKDMQLDLKRLKQRLEFEAELERSASVQAGAAIETSGVQMGTVSAQQAPVSTGDAGPARTTSSAEVIISEIKRHKPSAWLVLAAFVVVIAAISFGLYNWIGQKSATPPQLNRLTTTGNATHATISPDGKHLAYVKEEGGQQSLWLILVATVTEERIVPAALVSYRGLTFSHDGTFVYYVIVDQSNPTGALYQKPVLGGEARRLLVNIGSPIALSPDSKRFAFVRGTLSKKESTLIVANADGIEEKTLATRKDPDSFSLGGPAWSPDGKTIACGYMNYTGDSYGSVIALQFPDGAEQPITTWRWAGDSGGVGRVAWLSDGNGLFVTTQGELGDLPQIWRLSYPDGGVQRITNDLNGYDGVSLTADSGILAALRADRLINIWVGPAGDARNAKQITTGAGREDGRGGLDWTHDGRIVYHSTRGGDKNIWVMSADFSGNKKLNLTSRCNYDFTVSLDGRYLVLGSCNTGTRHVWRVGLDGSNPTQLTFGDGEWFPQCSPDGNWVVYGGVDSAAAMLSLWRVPIDGGTPERLTDKRSWVPRISPDQKLIACNYYDETTSLYKIAVIPFEGGPPIKIFDVAGGFTRRIQWTPNGRAVAYIVNRDGVSNLWGQPIDGGPPRQLTDFKDLTIFNFAWSRDGEQLALSRGVINSDVVLISGLQEK